MVMLYAPESLPVSSSADGLTGVRSRAGPSAMECGVGAVQQVVGKDGKERVRNNGTRHAQRC
jgi:hypothetical protein